MSNILSRLYPELRSELLQWLDEHDMMALIAVNKSWEPLIQQYIKSTMRPWYDIHMLKALAQKGLLLTIMNLDTITIPAIAAPLEGATSARQRTVFHYVVEVYVNDLALAQLLTVEIATLVKVSNTVEMRQVLWNGAFAAACCNDDREFLQEILNHPAAIFGPGLLSNACKVAARYSHRNLITWLVESSSVSLKGDVDYEAILYGACIGNDNNDNNEQIALASEMLKKLDHDVTVTTRAYLAAAQGGNLPLLKWVEDYLSNPIMSKLAYVFSFGETHPSSDELRQYLLQNISQPIVWTDDDIRYAMHLACSDGNLSLVQWLETQVPIIAPKIWLDSLEKATLGNFRPVMEWCASHLTNT